MNNQKYITTRRIRLDINYPTSDKEAIINTYKKLKTWQKIIFEASNITSSLLYLQENLKNISFFTDEYKIKLSKNYYDENCILNTSRLNSINREISLKYNAQIPTDILDSQIHSIYSYFNKERDDYYTGKRSLRSYKSNLSVPIKPRSIINLKYDNKIKNFTFSLFKNKKYIVPLKTHLGSDKNNTKAIIEKCITHEYKLLTSSYSFNTKGQLFFNLKVEIPITKKSPQRYKTAFLQLAITSPIILKVEGECYEISDNTTYLHKRRAIQNSLARKKKNINFINGGRGKTNKFKSIIKSSHKEKNYINTYYHQISSKIIKICINYNINKLILSELTPQLTEIQKDNYLRNNISISIFLNKLKYKCNNNNIDVIIT